MANDDVKKVAIELFARFSAGDTAGALEMLSDDATWWIAGGLEQVPGSGEHTKEQIAPLLMNMAHQLKSGLQMTVHSLVAEGDRVAVEVSSYGELHNGRVYRNEYHFALTIRGGKIAVVREYLDTKHVEATWFHA